MCRRSFVYGFAVCLYGVSNVHSVFALLPHPIYVGGEDIGYSIDGGWLLKLCLGKCMNPTSSAFVDIHRIVYIVHIII